MAPPPDIPDLTLLRRIGSGSYGDVWLARTLTGVYRAVKIVDRARFPDDRPFQRELEGISRFQRGVGDQPRQLALMHVARLEEQGLLYYVMELADDVTSGTDIDPERYEPLTLKSLRVQRPVLPAAECVRLGVELARGLAGLHAAGLIHRDVKPSNIILVNGVPKLADIGLVSSREASVTSLGTPGYSPPEGSGSLTADLWGLGRILYELVTGLNTKEFPRLPAGFDQRDDARVLLELNEVFLRACEPDVRDRYPTAQAMLDELLLIQAGRSVQDLNRTRARLRSLVRAAGVAAAVAVGAIAVLGVMNYFSVRALAEQEAAARIAAEANERRERYAANLHIAELAVVNGDLGVARAALRRELPASAEAADPRGPEWHALWQATAGNAVRTWGTAGSAPIEAMALAPDGASIATLHATPGRELVERNLVTGDTRALATDVWRLGDYTGDGQRLILGLNDGTLRLLTPATGAVSAAQVDDVRLIDAARDGRTVLLGSPAAAPTRLRVWDVEAQAEVGAWEPGAQRAGTRIKRAIVSRDGGLIAVHLEAASEPQSEVIVWDFAAQTERLRRSDVGLMTILAFSPDATRLVVASIHQPAQVFDLRDGSLQRQLAGVPALAQELVIAPTGRQLAAAGQDGSVRVLDLETGALVADLRGHESVVETLAWSGDGRRLYSGSADGTAREWEPGAASPAGTAAGGFWRGYLGTPVWSPDGDYVVATLEDGRLARIDPATLAPVGSPWNAHVALGFAAEGLRALSRERELVVINTGSGAIVPTGLRLEGDSPVYLLAASDAADVVVLGQADGTVTMWDTTSRTVLLQDRRHGSGIRAVAVSRDGTWAATAELRGPVWLWRPRDRQAVREIPHDGVTVTNLVFSNDAARCVLFSRSGQMTVWDLAAQQEEQRRHAYTQGCLAAVFSVDGSRLISAGHDNLLLFWSTPEFRPLAALTVDPQAGESVAVCGLALSPDGEALIALTEDGRLRRWSFAR